jgi:hypothetical protein
VDFIFICLFIGLLYGWIVAGDGFPFDEQMLYVCLRWFAGSLILSCRQMDHG